MDENKKQTIMAFIRLACMLISTGAMVFGISVDADAIFVGVMVVVAVVTYFWAWWKNNNVSKAATEAQKVLDEMKQGVESVFDEDEVDAA